MNKIKVLVAIIVPILAMAYWVLTVGQAVLSGNLVHLAVRGYDPRDLLSGHYLIYQLDFGDHKVCTESKRGERCVCLEESNSSVKLSNVTWSGECSALPPNCTAFLRGQCEYLRFTAGVERYYFPEEYSDALLSIPEGASVMISTDKNGKGVVLDFLVNQQPYQTYVEESRDKMAKAAAATTPAP